MSHPRAEPISADRATQAHATHAAFTDQELFSWLRGNHDLRAGPARLLALLVREAAANGYADRGNAVYAYRVGCSQRTLYNYTRVLQTAGLIRIVDCQEHNRIFVEWARCGLVRRA